MWQASYSRSAGVAFSFDRRGANTDTPGEAGLPKVSIPTTRFTVNGLDGDYNRFRVNKKQNDPDMAVMLISMDILNDLNNEGWPVMPGDLGENLTLENIDYSSIQPGQKYAVGSAEIEISCKLKMREA